jgi:hypothetical protein
MLGVGVAVAFVATLVALSGLTSVVDASGDARIRLSWRTVGEHIEDCRRPTEDELAALPAHMRQREICDRRLAPFQLDVRIDGETAISREVRPSGARDDRPAYVFEEIRLAPGHHRLAVTFAVVSENAVAAPLTLREDVELVPNAIVLVTLDDDSGELVLARRRP